jgi:DNA-binding response OmpR family regulator
MGTRRRPSLVVLDWMLPDIDGTAVAQHSRAVYVSAVPIRLLTADDRGTANAAQIDAYAFLPKPLE